MARGRLIYFAGLDGSGKTTQAERVVAERADPDQQWVYRWVRWEPRLTGVFMALARKRIQRGATSQRPADDAGHQEFVSGKRTVFRQKWRRDLWTLLVLLEYLPQMAWRLLPPLWTNKTVVCDRYVPDVWIDLALNFDEGFAGVQRLARHPLSRLFPRPDHVVFLELPARTGYERKMDGTPLAYLEEREELYARLPELFEVSIIDARPSAEEVARAVAAALDGLD